MGNPLPGSKIRPYETIIKKRQISNTTPFVLRTGSEQITTENRQERV